LYYSVNVDTAQTCGKATLGEHSLNGKKVLNINAETKMTCSLTATLQRRGRAKTRIHLSCPLHSCI